MTLPREWIDQWTRGMRQDAEAWAREIERKVRDKTVRDVEREEADRG